MVQIKDCDGTLIKVGDRLAYFHSTLGAVNDEIRSLESQTRRINVKLHNRQAAERELSDWIAATSVPPDLIQDVRHGHPDQEEDYIPVLHSLKEKIKLMESIPSHQSLPAYPVLKVRCLLSTCPALLACMVGMHCWHALLACIVGSSTCR